MIIALVQVEWMFNRAACLELTHNWGTEDDSEYKAHNGNEEPKGWVQGSSVLFTQMTQVQ